MPTKTKLLLILFLATIIRFCNISNIPSLNPDEAALGYNAYSLLETGRDEHGSKWPIHFKSFGDYKPGGYIYLLLPSIKLLGLTVFSTRLPNLLFSVFSIYLVFKLTLLLTSKPNLALLSSLILSISPWHIHFSRGAWEANTSMFFIILGLYFLYSYILKTKDFYLYIFPIPFAISLYIYHSARIIVPLLSIYFFLVYYRSFFNKKFIFSLFVGFLFSLPVFISFFKNGGTTRFSGVGLFSDTGPLSRSEELLNQHPNFTLYDRIIHNKRILYFLSFTQNYFSHFNFNFLFLEGDAVPRSKNPGMGQLYLLELPLLFLGLINLSKKFYTSHFRHLIFSLLFISPLASSLTFQSPSALRSLSEVLPLIFLVSIGLYSIKLKILKILFSILYLISFIYFLDSYFVHSPIRYSFAWNRGFSEIIPFIESQKKNYENIFITDKYDQPYILYLFFSLYPPQNIQPQIRLTPADKFGFSTVLKIDNLSFKIPDIIPPHSLVVDSSDFQSTGQSFKIYTK